MRITFDMSMDLSEAVDELLEESSVNTDEDIQSMAYEDLAVTLREFANKIDQGFRSGYFCSSQFTTEIHDD